MRHFLPLLIIAVCISVFRIPSFDEPHWYDDEQIYLAIGKALSRGEQLYVDITDNKPPILYWWVSLNPTLWWLKFSASVFVIMSTIYLYFFTKVLKFSALAQWLTLGSFMLVTNLPRYEGNIFNAELMYMPLTLLALYLSWKWIISPFKKSVLTVAIGFLAGLATLIKVPALAEFVAILVSLTFLSPASVRQKLVALVQILAGFLISWAVFSLFFVFQGSFHQFLFNTFLYNVKYIGDWKQVSTSPMFQALSPVSVRLLLLAGTLSATLMLYRFKVISKSVAFTIVWLFCSWFGTLISLRPYAHYLLPLSLPATLALGKIADTKFRQQLILFVLVAGIYSYVFSVPFELYRSQEYYRNWYHYRIGQKSHADYIQWFNQKTAIADSLSQFLNSHAHRQETLFVWGNLAAVYAQTDLKTYAPYPTDYLVHSYQAYGLLTTRIGETPPDWIVYCHASDLEFEVLNDLRDSTRYFTVLTTSLCDLHHRRPLPMLQ